MLTEDTILSSTRKFLRAWERYYKFTTQAMKLIFSQINDDIESHPKATEITRGITQSIQDLKSWYIIREHISKCAQQEPPLLSFMPSTDYFYKPPGHSYAILTNTFIESFDDCLKAKHCKHDHKGPLSLDDLLQSLEGQYMAVVRSVQGLLYKLSKAEKGGKVAWIYNIIEKVKPVLKVILDFKEVIALAAAGIGGITWLLHWLFG